MFILEESQLSFPFVYYRPLCIFKDLRQAYPWSLKTTNKSVFPWSRFLTHFVLAHLLCKEVDSSEQDIIQDCFIDNVGLDRYKALLR